MDYQNTLTYLYESAPMFQQIGSGAYKEGLENTKILDEYFGHRLPLFCKKQAIGSGFILLPTLSIFANVSVSTER